LKVQNARICHSRNAQSLTVRVEVSETDADLRRLDQLSRNLLREFRALGVEAERSREEAPAGSKSGIAVTVWALAVAAGNSPGFANLVSGMFGWLERGRGRTIQRASVPGA
jgi:hypothetical protein